MCGIAGWFSSNPNTEQQQPALQRMVTAIAHRGPDGSGTQMHRHAALGHTRLAIIDLNNGAQPMHSHDQHYSIVFNGEIYNFQALRSELINHGHGFNTNSDTEVIIELYRAHGWQGFNKLRGMYAFALWDHQQKVGVLVRDPLGIKPLFIKNEKCSISFASEAKAILAKTETKAQLDTASLHLLMNFRYLPGQRTLFKDITQVKPGEVILWQPDHQIETQQLQPVSPQQTSTLDALRDSVASHFTADVEVGAYLSGGIDSASIVALGKNHSSRPLRTFTLRAGDDPNEARYAARSAEIFGVKNIQGDISHKLNRELPHLIWHLETPKINALQVGLLAQQTARHVKVALSGLGGDELFYGYNAHKFLLKAHQTSQLLPGFISHGLGGTGARMVALLQKPVWTESERALRMLQSLGDWPRVYGLLRNVWDQPRLRSLIYGPRMLDSPLPDAFGEIESRWPSQQKDPVAAMAEYEFSNKMVNDLLWQEDRVSMAAGLEVRVPFVDHVLAAHVQQFNRAELMPHNQPKGYMRNTLRELLPDEILNRPKSGFQVSSPDFFHKHLKSLADVYLSAERINKSGLFNHRFVEHVLRQPVKTGLRWHYFILYLMLLTHIWIDLFEQQNDPANFAISY